MYKRGNWRRLLCGVLTVALLSGLAVPASATGDEDGYVPLRFEEVDGREVAASMPPDGGVPLSLESDGEPVRVSIVLVEPSTLEAGYAARGVARNPDAMAYREGLRRQQDRLRDVIEREVLDGGTLDVVWNLTLAANIISANVRRGDISAIRALEGVADVVEETALSSPATSDGALSPQMSSAGEASGSWTLWSDGYTGAGTRIAVIDTGIDINHLSFDAGAFEYSLDSLEDFDRELLLDRDDIAGVLEQLNAYAMDPGLTADKLYKNSKIPYAYNYIDHDAEYVGHLEDEQTDHGSHVSGIAAANRFVDADGDGRYEDALDEVLVTGVAPDAQLIVMKVFGREGSSTESDDVATIEDAILLGADAINMSLGAYGAGFASNPVYQEVMERLVESDVVLAAASGNSHYWGEYTENGDLYSDGVNFATDNSPSTYAGTLAVASAQNTGLTVQQVRIGGNKFEIHNMDGAPLTSLDTSADGSGTAYDCFYLPSALVDASDSNPLASYAGEIKGGILVSDLRLIINYGSSFENVHMAAEACGAVACILLFDLNGVNLSMSGSAAQIPFAILDTAVGDSIIASGSPAEEDGCYHGSITVSGRAEVIDNDPGYYVMSNFSSWGVPGDLSLKPEITSFGGGIYSVWGATADASNPQTAHDQYISRNGTSMATPMVSGMAALMKQYMREEGIGVPELSTRALIQSLLMSTAQAITDEDGSYYSVFQQGSGLANVVSALSSPVYITVEGQGDGKVKAVLGDDPGREGRYTVAFTLHNMSGADLEYRLSAAVFTQDIETYDGIDYLSTATRAMDAEVGFAADGVPVRSDVSPAYDFNGDGNVDRADAHLLLDHLIQGAGITHSADSTDVDGDGDTDTHDVHTLLGLLPGAVTVPAGGSRTVTADITLTQQEAERLSRDYPAGAYVEAFLFAEPLPDAAGDPPPTLSVPVLGFYGSWSESPMFDVGTANDHSDDTRDAYISDSQNVLVLNRASESGGSRIVYYGYNPWDEEEEEYEHYSFDREALNPAHDSIERWVFSLIRNAGDSRFRILDAEGGALYTETFGGQSAAFYRIGWNDYDQDITPSVDLSALGLENNQKLTLELTMALEYYVRDGRTDWGALSDGASLRLPITVDTEKPEITAVVGDSESGALRISARDNQYIAAILLCDDSGDAILETRLPMQESPDTEFAAEFEDLSDSVYLAQVWDYAGNERTYRVFLGEEASGGVNRTELSDSELTPEETGDASPGDETPSAEEEVSKSPVEDAPTETDVESLENDVASADVRSNSEILSAGEDSQRLSAQYALNAGDPSIGAVAVGKDSVTVPVSVQDSTNGRLTLRYDPSVLTWVSGFCGDALVSVKADVATGAVEIGYAAAGAFSGTIVNALFSYKSSTVSRTTELSVLVRENGARHDDDPVPVGTAVTLSASAPETSGPSGWYDSSASSGGASSGGGTVSAPSTSGGRTTVRVTVSSSVSGATASADLSGVSMSRAVSEAVAEAARQGAVPVVEVKVATSAGADSLHVTLPVSSLEMLAGAGGSSLIITSGVAEVALDHTALSALAGQAGGSTVILRAAPVAASSLTAAQRAVVGGAPVMELSLVSGGTAIRDYDSGTIRVTLPYTLPSGQSADDVVVYYLGDSGDLTACSTTYGNGKVTFTTTRLSRYVIADRTLADRRAGGSFTDVDASAYYADAVAWAVANGITYGITDTAFGPEMTCTRAQIVTFLWRQAGSPAAGGSNPFADVSASEYYYDAVLWAVENGITDGVSPSAFAPGDICTRAQAMSFLYRAKGSPAAGGTNRFADVSVGDYFAEAVRWAVSAGVTYGVSDTQFGPHQDCTRAQIVSFLYRAYA